MAIGRSKKVVQWVYWSYRINLAAVLVLFAYLMIDLRSIGLN